MQIMIFKNTILKSKKKNKLFNANHDIKIAQSSKLNFYISLLTNKGKKI